MGYLVKEPVLKLFKKILSRRFLPHDTLYLKHRVFAMLGREPIIVYTMGKVGSTTVHHAFQEQYFFPLTYQVHHLTDTWYQIVVNRYKKNDLTISDKINLSTLFRGNVSHISASRILRKPRIANSNRTWNIITLVRDPFSTFLSHLFQNPQIVRPFLLDANGILDKNKVERYIDEIFSEPHPEKDFISNWFDEEFFEFTGVDLYKHPFDTEIGYTIIREKRFNIAVISLESLDKNLPLIIKEFTNSNKDISVKKKNVRNKDDKSGLYKELKNNIRVSRKELEKFYSTKYAKHFFSDDHINRMIDRWAKDEQLESR